MRIAYRLLPNVREPINRINNDPFLRFFLPALKAGGDAGKVMWLASCGLEYPDVGVRVMEAPQAEGDNVTLKVFRGATPEEIQAATEANMLVKVVGQPGAKRLEKDAPVRFTGTLVGYTQTPFLLTWD